MISNINTLHRAQRNRFIPNLHIDWSLFLGVALLSILGLIILYSSEQNIKLIYRQGLRLGLATILMIFIAHIHPRVLRNLAPLLYGISIGLLVIVLFIGYKTKGAQSWINLSFIRFQPSELMKIALPLMMARYLEQQFLPPKLTALFWPVIFIILPVLLIVKQNDLGVAVMIFSTGILVLFFAGLTLRFMLTIGGLIVSALPLIWYCLRDHQRARVLTLLNPERDPLGSGYQIIQSKIALGSGGLYGKGWLAGTQSHLEFLPERATDFIFAVFGEEFGLVGCLMLLVLYLCIIMRGLYISVQAQDTFTRLLAGSLVMTFFIYVFINIGMVIGILPVVGIPLPLVSFGGSSLITFMASFGILMSIHTHRRLVTK